MDIMGMNYNKYKNNSINTNKRGTTSRKKKYRRRKIQ